MSKPNTRKMEFYDYVYHNLGIESEQCHYIVEDLLKISNKDIAEFLEDLNKCVNTYQYTILRKKWEERQKQ